MNKHNKWIFKVTLPQNYQSGKLGNRLTSSPTVSFQFPPQAEQPSKRSDDACLLF